MPKYLRYLDLRTSLMGSASIGLADAEIEAVLRSIPSAGRLTWMLEHYALPLETLGISKVLIYLVQGLCTPPPIVVPLTPEHREDVEGMAEILQPIDVPAFAAMSPHDKQTYLLDLIHAALVRCAEHFRWNRQPLDAARERILQDDFRFEFDWKKPLASPDRKHKVQARLVVTDQLRIWLIFYDRGLNEIDRKLLCTGGVGKGAAKFALHRIAWRDAETVCVTQENNRDFWLCTISGQPEFHYPRAERGDPHGLYDLGQFYLEGRFVAHDPVRGRELIEAAASKGFVPARRWLSRVGQDK